MKFQRMTLLCAVLAVALGLMVLSGCTDEGPTSSTTQPATASTTSADGGSSTTEGLAGPAEGDLGQEMTVAGWQITVDSVETAAEMDGVQAREGEELVITRFTVKNTLGRPMAVTAEDFTLIESDGGTHRPIGAQTGLFTAEAVPAGGTGSTYAIFSVPVGSTGLTLRFSPFIEGKTVPREVDIALD